MKMLEQYRNLEQTLKGVKEENETLRRAAAAAPALAAAAPATTAAAHAASPVPKTLAADGQAPFFSPTPPYSPPSGGVPATPGASQAQALRDDAATAALQAKVADLEAMSAQHEADKKSMTVGQRAELVVALSFHCVLHRRRRRRRRRRRSLAIVSSASYPHLRCHVVGQAQRPRGEV